MRDLLTESSSPWVDPAAHWSLMNTATAARSAPLAAINRAALRHNALDLLARAGGVPIRVASAAVRSRALLNAVLALPGYRGILASTLAEALWLALEHDDVLVGYPTVDRATIVALAGDEDAARRITLMVDDTAHLDVIDEIVPPQQRPRIRVAIDVDASWRRRGLGHIGVRRSPLHQPAEAATLARAVAARKGFELVGVMMYEAQIAAVPDSGGAGGGPIRAMQRRSVMEVRERRAQIVQALRGVTPLEFVNGGGTGSLETTADDLSVTEVTAGSGLLAGHVFDGYRSFTPLPAVAFALDIVRKPTADIVVVLGGGGAAGRGRRPMPVWPEGLRTLARAGGSDVHVALQGESAKRVRIGDRVWFRPARSGELGERIGEYSLVDGAQVIADVATYRGEGKAFL